MFKDRINLLRNKNFSCLVLSNFLTVTGGGLCYIAITWYVLTLNNHISSVIINSLCFWLPSTLFGPFAGNWVDRLPRKWVLFCASMLRALSFMSFATLLLVKPHIYWCYTMSAMNGLLFAFISPAGFALVNELVSKENLTAANATMDMVFETGNILGMGIAGVLMHFFGISALFYMVGAIILIGNLFILIIKINKDQQRHERKAVKVFKDFYEALQYLSKHSDICLLYILNLCVYMQFMTSPVVLAPFVKTVLHQNAHIFSLVEIFLSIGIVMGGLFIPVISKKIGWYITVLIGILFTGLGLTSLYWIHHTAFTCAIYFINGFWFTYWVLAQSKAQALTAGHFQGRLQSLLMSVSALLIVVFYIVLERGSHYIHVIDCYLILACFSLFALAALFWLKLQEHT